MQVAEGEGAGSVLTYVTKPEFRKQRSRSPSSNSLLLEVAGILHHLHRLADRVQSKLLRVKLSKWDRLQFGHIIAPYTDVGIQRLHCHMKYHIYRMDLKTRVKIDIRE